MNLQELDADLPVQQRALTLTTSSVGGLLQSFLTTTYGGMPLVIAGATKSLTSDAVIVNGTASLLNVANAPVHAVFTLEADGSVVATIAWLLPIGWKFSTSFPVLPVFADARSTTPTSSSLDQLVLGQGSFMLSTAPGTDPRTGAPLAAGLNFVAPLMPSGVFGLFQALLGPGALTLSGTITLPVATRPTPPLPPLVLPWQTTWSVPGIALAAPMGIRFTVGALRVHDAALRIYSPTAATWLAANPTYQPLLAIGATLDVPSAILSAAVTDVYSIDSGAAVLICDFAGATLDKLALLRDLVNGTDLETILPAKVVSALQSISLERVSLGFSGGLSADAVQFVTVQVGLPNVRWRLLDAPVVIELGNLDANFLVASPFGPRRSLTVTLGGHVAIAGAAFHAMTQYPGFATRLDLAPDTTIPLREIFATLAPALPTPPALTISSMSLAVVPGQSYAFSARIADDPPWTLALGPVSMTVSSVAIDIASAGTGAVAGTFSGTLEFGGGIELAMRYDTPGAFVIRADFPEVKLSQIIAQLDQLGVQLPTGFDLDLKQAYALVQEQGSSFTFSAAALVDNVGLVALTAEKTTGWGFAAGVQLGNGSVSSLPGFGPLSALASFVGLTELLVVVSSLDQLGFQFPDMAAFQAPPLNGHSISLPPQASGVVRGVNAYAQLSAATNPGLKLLADYLGVRLDGSVGITLAVSAPDPATHSKLFASVDTTINHVTSLQGELGVLLLNGDPGVFLTGTLNTSIQGQAVAFAVNAIVLPTGVLISGTMAGSVHFSLVTLSNVAIEIGIDDVGIPSLGFAATIDVPSFDSSIAVFFDSTDPRNSMFAGAISDVTLLSIATTIAGQGRVPSPLDDALRQFALKGLQAFQLSATAGASLDARDLAAIRRAFAQGGVTLPPADERIFFVVNTPRALWHLTDLSTMLHYELRASGSAIDVARQPQLYCAPQPTTIGTLKYPQGIHVIAEIDAFLIKAKIQVEISASTGIAADVSVAPMSLVSTNFFAITGGGPDGGPLLSFATYDQPTKTDPQLRPPHFLLIGAMHILGVDAASIYVSISAQGLTFHFAEIRGTVQFTLDGSVTSTPAVTIGGSVDVGIDQSFDAGPLGHIAVSARVAGSLAMSGSASGGQATVRGSFNFQGSSLTIPPLSLDITGPALANVAQTVWTQVVDILKKVLTSADAWLGWLKAGIVSGAGQTAAAVGQALSDVYHLPAQDILDKTKQVLGYGLSDLAEALKGGGVTAQNAANLLVSAGYSVASVASTISRIFSGGAHADFSIGHIDTPAGPHADTSGERHADTPARLHLDTPAAPHGDTPSAPHGDTPRAPHGDVGSVHADFSTHVDSGHGFWHWDTSVGHVDRTVTPHIDTPVYPHIDTPLYPHIDTPLYPHIDTAAVPHVDTTPIPHVDGPVPPHGDTGTHVDT